MHRAPTSGLVSTALNREDATVPTFGVLEYNQKSKELSESAVISRSRVSSTFVLFFKRRLIIAHRIPQSSGSGPRATDATSHSRYKQKIARSITNLLIIPSLVSIIRGLHVCSSFRSIRCSYILNRYGDLLTSSSGSFWFDLLDHSFVHLFVCWLPEWACATIEQPLTDCRFDWFIDYTHGRYNFSRQCLCASHNQIAR